MKRMSLIAVISALLLLTFLGVSQCEERKAGQPSKKTSIMDRIKKAYSDFRNRGQAKKAAAVPAPAAKKDEPQKLKEAPSKPVKAEYTKDEMVSDIKDDLETYDEIVATLPGLKAEKDEKGKISFTYNGVILEDMSKEDLQPLFNKVRQLAVKLRTERIQRQLDITRRASAGPAPRVPVSAPPAVSQPPRVPASKPSVPKPASPPPAPPSRRY